MKTSTNYGLVGILTIAVGYVAESMHIFILGVAFLVMFGVETSWEDREDYTYYQDAMIDNLTQLREVSLTWLGDESNGYRRYPVFFLEKLPTGLTGLP